MNERELLWILVEFAVTHATRACDLVLAVTAEGVGTVRPFARVRDLGIERSQGFHHSAPDHAGASAGRSGLPTATVAGKPA